MEVKESAATYSAKKKIYTYEDYLKLPDDRNRYEIIDGELIMTPAPKMNHQRISGVIELQLRLFVERNKLGEVFDAPCDVLLTDENILQPDILFVATDLRHFIGPDVVTIVVACSSQVMRCWKNNQPATRNSQK